MVQQLLPTVHPCTHLVQCLVEPIPWSQGSCLVTTRWFNCMVICWLVWAELWGDVGTYRYVSKFSPMSGAPGGTVRPISSPVTWSVMVVQPALRLGYVIVQWYRRCLCSDGCARCLTYHTPSGPPPNAHPTNGMATLVQMLEYRYQSSVHYSMVCIQCREKLINF